MKYFLILLLLAVAAAFATGGSAPTFALTAGGNYEWNKVKSFDGSVFPDTLTDTDSSVWVNMQPVQSGYEYILHKGVTAGQDSLMIIRLDLYDENKVFIESVALDTLRKAAGNMLLPIFRTKWCSFFSVVPKTGTVNASCIVAKNKVKLLSRRVINYTPALR